MQANVMELSRKIHPTDIKIPKPNDESEETGKKGERPNWSATNVISLSSRHRKAACRSLICFFLPKVPSLFKYLLKCLQPLWVTENESGEGTFPEKLARMSLPRAESLSPRLDWRYFIFRHDKNLSPRLTSHHHTGVIIRRRTYVASKGEKGACMSYSTDMSKMLKDRLRESTL